MQSFLQNLSSEECQFCVEYSDGRIRFLGFRNDLHIACLHSILAFRPCTLCGSLDSHGYTTYTSLTRNDGNLKAYQYILASYFTLEVENDNSLSFLDVLFLKTLTGCQQLSSENHFQSLFLLMLFPISLLNRKWLLSILTSNVLYVFPLILLISPMNLIT